MCVFHERVRGTSIVCMGCEICYYPTFDNMHNDLFGRIVKPNTTACLLVSWSYPAFFDVSPQGAWIPIRFRRRKVPPPNTGNEIYILNHRGYANHFDVTPLRVLPFNLGRSGCQKSVLTPPWMVHIKNACHCGTTSKIKQAE